MAIYKAAATCAFGLESVLSFELKRLGMNEVTSNNGRVFFSTDEQGLARANLWLRTAERVLIILAEYPAPDFDALFEGVRSVDWKSIIAKKDAFPVKGYSMDSKLTSVPACQSIVKKAIVEKLKQQYQSEFLPETGARVQIRFSIVKDICTVMLDTSGDGLHKRGWRPLSNLAPIKETLAAGIIDLARIRADSTVRDCFCGSGTLVIEAAQKAKNIAPGLNRSFALCEYGFIGSEALQREKQAAREAIIKDAPFVGRGSDLDPSAVQTAVRNAAAAGVADCCEFFEQDACTAQYTAEDIVLANPPYGERLSDDAEIQSLYKAFCRNLTSQKYKSFYMITNYPMLEHDMGKPAVRRRKLYNGTIPCQLFMYF